MKVDFTRRELARLKEILGPMPALRPNGQQTNSSKAYGKIADALDDVDKSLAWKRNDIAAYQKMIEKIEAEIKELE